MFQEGIEILVWLSVILVIFGYWKDIMVLKLFGALLMLYVAFHSESIAVTLIFIGMGLTVAWMTLSKSE